MNLLETGIRNSVKDVLEKRLKVPKPE